MIHIDLFSCLFVIFVCLVSATIGHIAIIGGQKAESNEFPYQATLIDTDGQDVCGGGIISDQFIVTAAHCVAEHKADFIKNRKAVLVGTNDLQKIQKPAVLAAVEKFYIPANFHRDEARFTNDIAVIKLKQRLTMSKHIEKLELPTNVDETYAGKPAKIAGFGWDTLRQIDHDLVAGRNTDDFLRFALADVLSHGQKGYEKAAVPDKQICARVKQFYFQRKTAGVCYGDSGSLLVHENTAIGVLSSSPTSCSEKDVCALYTRITHYLDFIDDAKHDRKHKDIISHVPR